MKNKEPIRCDRAYPHYCEEWGGYVGHNIKNKKMKKKELTNFVNAVIIKLIMVSVCEGEGTEESPRRLVHYYLDFDGNIIFKKDTK